MIGKYKNSDNKILTAVRRYNPVTVLSVILSVIILTVISDNIYEHFIIFLIISLAVSTIDFKILFTIINKFRIFLLLSFLFSFISTGSFMNSSNISLKVISLLILSFLLNVLIDLKALLLFFKKSISKIRFIPFKNIFQKVLLTFLLGIVFIEELFDKGKEIVSKRKKSHFINIKNNVRIIQELFLFCFQRAGSMEKNDGLNSINSKNIIPLSFKTNDKIILIFSFLSVIAGVVLL